MMCARLFVSLGSCQGDVEKWERRRPVVRPRTDMPMLLLCNLAPRAASTHRRCALLPYSRGRAPPWPAPPACCCSSAAAARPLARPASRLCPRCAAAPACPPARSRPTSLPRARTTEAAVVPARLRIASAAPFRPPSPRSRSSPGAGARLRRWTLSWVGRSHRPALVSPAPVTAKAPWPLTRGPHAPERIKK